MPNTIDFIYTNHLQATISLSVNLGLPEEGFERFRHALHFHRGHGCPCNKHQIPSGRDMRSLLAHGLAHQALGPIANHGIAHSLASHHAHTSRRQAIRLRYQHQKPVCPGPAGMKDILKISPCAKAKNVPHKRTRCRVWRNQPQGTAPSTLYQARSYRIAMHRARLLINSLSS